MKIGDFRHISSIFGRKNFFSKSDRLCFEHSYYASLCKKSEKTNDEISRKRQKTGFSGIFPAFSAGKKSEKTNEQIPRKAGNRRTDGRTDEHRLI